MIEIWVLLIGLGVQAVFFAGVQIMTNKSYGRRIDNLETHNNLQDKQIAETHTGVQVIIKQLEFMSKIIETTNTRLETLENNITKVMTNSHPPGACA